MQTIREKVYTHYAGKRSNSMKKENFLKFIQKIQKDIEKVNVKLIRKSKGYRVRTYRELVKYVAELGYLNPQFNLLYRGQDTDYTNTNGSIIYPSIFRSESREPLPAPEIEERFERLNNIHMKLHNNMKNVLIPKYLQNYPEYYYALVQHYEMSKTPLIDLTQSLHVAATFALRKGTHGYVLVFGMPHPHGSISHFIDQEMVLVKLQNVCPPNALRPHYQEGYLAGNLPFKEVLRLGDDLARRLIGKYYLDNSNGKFWDNKFDSIPDDALFPKDDSFQKELKDVL